MLDWLRRVYNGVAGLIPKSIRQYVYHLVHGVAGIINTVFGHVGGGWVIMWNASRMAMSGLVLLGRGIQWFAVVVYRKWLPALRNWAARKLYDLGKYIGGVEKYLMNLLDALRKAAWNWVQNAIKWVVKNVWDPLWSYAQYLWKQLVKWGYTAWWYITHPDKLAERLFWFMVDIVKREVWKLASIFGTFGLKTFLANVPRVAQLIEKIIADVL